jgi:hypothetical protein
MAVSLLAAGVVLWAAPVAEPKGPRAGNGPASAEPPVVEVRFRDNSLVKLTLQIETITLITRYGRLTIPTADINKIEFATRVPEAVTRRVEAAVKALGSKDFKQREQAGKELVQIGAPAYAPLQAAAESDDAEVKHAAEDLVATIKESTPEELLVHRDHDIIHTKDSRFTGTIENGLFRAVTVPFGEVQVKLADMRRLRSVNYTDADADDDTKLGAGFPGQVGIAAFINQVGKKLTITATGNANGAVWGTGVYTPDSDLGAAAVHMGVLKVGQTGQVKVQIVPAPPAFNGSVQNGIASAPWPGGRGTAYQILKPR